MRSTQRCCSLTVAAIVFSALVALPAVAITEEEMWAICEEWMFNHEGDQEWEQSCMEAIQEWESQQPPEVIIQEIKYPPAGPFPTQET
ncbi:MAG: hypothetical protein ACREA0_11120, partial [bacterium]